jgi:hypothetical protein
LAAGIHLGGDGQTYQEDHKHRWRSRISGSRRWTVALVGAFKCGSQIDTLEGCGCR